MAACPAAVDHTARPAGTAVPHSASADGLASADQAPAGPASDGPSAVDPASDDRATGPASADPSAADRTAEHPAARTAAHPRTAADLAPAAPAAAPGNSSIPPKIGNVHAHPTEVSPVAHVESGGPASSDHCRSRRRGGSSSLVPTHLRRARTTRRLRRLRPIHAAAAVKQPGHTGIYPSGAGSNHERAAHRARARRHCLRRITLGYRHGDTESDHGNHGDPRTIPNCRGTPKLHRRQPLSSGVTDGSALSAPRDLRRSRTTAPNSHGW